jgi:TolB protein
MKMPIDVVAKIFNSWSRRELEGRAPVDRARLGRSTQDWNEGLEWFLASAAGGSSCGLKGRAPRWVGMFAALILLVGALVTPARSADLGNFESHGDVGRVGKAGAVEYDAGEGRYTITGGGANMWATNDAFHYVWKRMSGDLALAADIRWIGDGGDPHRKACLIIRQTLEADSPYVDAVVHGEGLTSLQYREAAGGPTREIQSSVSKPGRIRIEKRGAYASMSIAPAGEALRPAGGTFRIQFKEPFYVGLAVCAHNDAVVEKAVFSKVEISALPPIAGVKPAVASTLEFVTVGSKDRRVVYHTRDLIEAPNWSRDGQYFIFNSKGRIHRLPVAGGEPKTIDTGFASRCNNDHGISPDGTQLVISDQSQERKSLIYTVPLTGGTPRRVTQAGPSYWHGWSPDGRTLAYCAERNGEFDIYTIPVGGGEERRLTTAPGLDDGPEYSPDGRFIYFNSERSGTMQIWRMKPDGTGQEPVTTDEFNNWFPHLSPDGRWMVFLTYPKDVKGHPENKDVALRQMPAGGGEIQVLATLFGGQGTINVPSWSPDSRRVAFVSYQWVDP